MNMMLTMNQSLHTEVLDPLHVLLALALELPEDYFLKIHSYEEKSEVNISAMHFVQVESERSVVPGPPPLHEVRQVHT